MTKKRRKKNWSYNAGERGRNWVRAYQQRRDGKYYVEWRENGRRRAVLLNGVTDPNGAKQKADELASKFSTHVVAPGPLTMRSLMTDYLRHPRRRNKITTGGPSGCGSRSWIPSRKSVGDRVGTLQRWTGSIGIASFHFAELDKLAPGDL